MKAYGKKVWLIPDAYLNSVSLNDSVSHEALCVINTSHRTAKITITLLFEVRDAGEGIRARCESMRNNHIRMDKLTNAHGELIPRDTPYALLVESSESIVCQYTRLDTSEREMALMTTIAYAVED